MTRHSLHLSIDPPPYSQTPPPGHSSPDSNNDSPASSDAKSTGTDGTTPTSGGSSSDGVIQSVLCMYDFVTSDPVHLPFRKNEILDVVKVEDTGWWAAMRKGGDIIGWIPRAFVQPLSDEMTERLWGVREELRVYEYEAEQLYNSAPISRIVLEEPQTSPPSARWNTEKPSSSISRPLYSPSRSESELESRRRHYPPSPVTPMPQPPPSSLDKPTPPTPRDLTIIPNRLERSSPPQTNAQLAMRNLAPVSTSAIRPNETSERSPNERRLKKIEQLTGSAAAVQATLVSPWHLRPRNSDQLTLDIEGQVRTGSIPALIERLAVDTKDPIKTAQETIYRNIFLMTFRTFMTADQLFDGLIELFHQDPPEPLADDQLVQWKERWQIQTQGVILTVLTMWLEDHRLLEEEPHIAQRLTTFLNRITPPHPLSTTAALIIKSVERLTFASPNSTSPSIAPRRPRRTRPLRGDLLSLKPVELAEQMCLHEHKLYSKISPQECLKYPKTPHGKEVQNLNNFCGTYDMIAAWVQTSILHSDSLGRRADTVDFWIKVAEKCKVLNNYNSMSAIISALSSTVITKLHLTWAHVGKKSTLEALVKYNDPTGGFAGYRNLQQQCEGPCVPFVGMYLSELIRVGEQFNDEDGRVCFLKRRRWYEVITVMLRSQSKPYNFAENISTLGFMLENLRPTSPKDQATFWTRSQEVQQSELAHADIRRGLEAAGF